MKSKLIISLFAMSGALSVIGCGGSGGPAIGPVTKVDGTQKAQYASNSVTLPASSTAVAFDIDGDGQPDNRLGSIIQAVTALKLNPQMSTDDAVKSGALLLLFAETSTDATQQMASNAGVVLNLAVKPATPPDYTATPSFMIDTATSAAQFYGNIAAGTYTSNDPSVATTPVTLTLVISLATGAPITLPVTAGRITFKRGADGKVTGGQINGAITKTDVDANVIPAVATLLTAQLMAPGACTPSTDTPPACTGTAGAMGALKMFDPNCDCTVTPAEIMGNALISNFLAPDVQLFQGGVYKPNPAKTTKDSLSLGLGFTAVPATF